jgi:hypothetical protein
MKTLCIIVIAIAGGLLSVDHAATAPGTSEDDIRAHAADISKKRHLLEDKDPNVRAAALEDMIKSPDPATQEIAYEVGFSTAEISLRSIALRYRILRRGAFVVDVRDFVSGDRKNFQAMPAHLSFPIQAVDEVRGLGFINYRAIKEQSDIVGQVSVAGQDVTLTVPIGSGNTILPCTGHFHLGDAGALDGTLTCRYGNLVTFKAAASVQ